MSMRIHIIACRIFTRELSWLASRSDNQVELTWVGRGLHNTPDRLRCRLKDAVDELYRQLEEGELENRPDYIVLGYGLCSRAVCGIRCRDIPIVIPRTDDCIALFMGSQERYLKEFSDAKGAYWLNSGWIEQSVRLFDTEDMKRRKWLEYAERFGEANADSLLELGEELHHPGLHPLRGPGFGGQSPPRAGGSGPEKLAAPGAGRGSADAPDDDGGHLERGGVSDPRARPDHRPGLLREKAPRRGGGGGVEKRHDAAGPCPPSCPFSSPLRPYRSSRSKALPRLIFS